MLPGGNAASERAPLIKLGLLAGRKCHRQRIPFLRVSLLFFPSECSPQRVNCSCSGDALRRGHQPRWRASSPPGGINLARGASTVRGGHQPRQGGHQTCEGGINPVRGASTPPGGHQPCQGGIYPALPVRSGTGDRTVKRETGGSRRSDRAGGNGRAPEPLTRTGAAGPAGPPSSSDRGCGGRGAPSYSALVQKRVASGTRRCRTPL